MGWLLAKFALWGVPEALRKPLLYLGAILAALALLGLLKGCYDRSVIREHDTEVNLAAEKGAREADTKAADQRLKDAATNLEQERALNDAIDNPKTGDPADPGVRLACEQLRQSGQDTTTIPACGGR